MLTVLTFLGIQDLTNTINITFPHNGNQQAGLCTIQVLTQSKWKPVNMQ
jgi:hypothetical protein